MYQKKKKGKKKEKRREEEKRREDIEFALILAYGWDQNTINVAYLDGRGQ